MPIIFVVASIVILYIGADWSLDASEEIGERLGMPKLLVGLLLVGLGTSLPEFFVSHLACLRGKPEMAVGNVIGSNLGNLFFILGLAAIITPLAFNSVSIRKQCTNHVILTLIVLALFRGPGYGVAGGVCLLCYFVWFLFQIYQDKKSQGASLAERSHIIPLDLAGKLLVCGKLLGGFALLYAGGELLVNGGIKIGKHFHVSDYVISVILFSFATSFPELVTSVMACLKKKDSNLIIGNILGSNIFNIAFVLGSMGFYNFSIDKDFFIELTVLTLGGIYILGFALKKASLHRLSGIFFMSVYGCLVYFWTRGA
jgi:cation:H+ antiporter